MLSADMFVIDLVRSEQRSRVEDRQIKYISYRIRPPRYDPQKRTVTGIFRQVTILKNKVRVTTSRSRVLIIDTVVSEVGVPLRMALQDVSMMTFGGMKRTLPQWKELLD